MARTVHHPHCNRNCTPAGHTFTLAERDHAHLQLMASQCALCRTELERQGRERGRR